MKWISIRNLFLIINYFLKNNERQLKLLEDYSTKYS